METALPSQPDQSSTFPDTPEELRGILEIPDRPEITGGYADVYHGFWTNPQGERVDVAIKMLKALNPRSRQSDQDSLVKKAETRIKREIFFWSQTRHPNLHPFLGYRLQPQPHLVSPWCRHGDLEYYLRSNPNLSRYEKLLLVYQAGCGLHHLHSCSPPICHADIKPRNVLINNFGQAALVDFGLSRAMLDLDVTSGFTTSETVKGTFAYMAGELSSGQKASCASDVYAFGGLILTVMSNQAPFHGLSQLVILRRIMQNESPKPEDHPDLPAQDPLWELMRRCWDTRPAARPTISEVLIELQEDIGLKQPKPQSSSDLATVIDAGGSDYSETDFETSAKHLQEAIDSSNTSKGTHDLVLEAVPEARSFSVSSKASVPLPSSVPSLIANSDQPTRTGDRRDKGGAFPRPYTEQQERLNTKPQPKTGRRPPDESLEHTPIREMAALWIHSAPPQIVASVSDQKKRRQEAIRELICTERDFVRDMEYLRAFLVKPLCRTDIITERHRAEFVDHAFRDLDEIIAVNNRLRNALNMRQKYAIVEKIRDIFSNLVKSLANPPSPTAVRTETLWRLPSQESQGWRCDCSTKAKAKTRHLESCPRNICMRTIECPCCSQIFVGGSRKSALKRHIMNFHKDKLHLMKKYKDTLDGISV